LAVQLLQLVGWVLGLLGLVVTGLLLESAGVPASATVVPA
jgi:hypothetical protein